MMKLMLKAVIFDMDGLLIDSEPFWHQSHREVVASYGHTITDDDVRAVAGRRTDEVAQGWHDRFPIKQATPDQTASAVIHKVIGHINQSGRALSGVNHVIKLFIDHHIPMAVASSSSPDIIVAVLERLGLQEVMQAVHSAVHEQHGKPDPAVFLTTASKLNVKPETCLVFEDSISGVQAAKAAGMYCIAVPEVVNRRRPELKIADQIVGSLANITWPLITALCA